MKKKPNFKIYGTDYKTPDGTCIRDYIHVSVTLLKYIKNTYEIR